MDDPREAERLEKKVNTAYWVDKYFKLISDAGDSTLEVGCGPGSLLSAVKKSYPRQHVFGIDISHERISYSRTHDSVHFVQANGLTLPFFEASFDTVYTRFLLEYLSEPEQIVEEIYRVCKPGGKVMLQDLDSQLITNWPIDESLESGINKIVGALASTGFDAQAILHG